MKLLFVTQKMDRTDAVLGAYHGWVAELAKRFDSIEVICLYEGPHDLPDTIRVHSLGKEKGERSSVTYALRFLKLAWTLRDSYDQVFVHMNQEYLLIAGWLWKLLGKRMYMWRNHYAGSWLTDIAAAFCTKVFCTSRYSYTAKYRKTVFMPVGIDLTRFHPDEQVRREPKSILFLARISPSKRPDLFIEALGLLLAKSISFTASVYGSPKAEDAAYYESLKARAEALGLKDRVQFHAAVPNEKTPDIYRAHEIFVNCSPSGMFDKTIFEAAACGCRVLATSRDLAALAGSDSYFESAEELAAKLARFLGDARSADSQIELAKQNGLETLAEELAKVLSY